MSSSRFYRLTLSPADKMIDVKRRDEKTGVIVDVKEPRRKWELDILTTCLSITAMQSKDITESIACSKLLAEMKEFPEAQNAIDISDHEAKYVKNGFEKSAGQRPGAWWQCIDILEQIANPRKSEPEGDSTNGKSGE